MQNALIGEGKVEKAASDTSKCEGDIFTLETLRSQINFLMRLVLDKGKKWSNGAKMRSVI